MPENIGSTGAPYNTKIPRIIENANIQTALRLYHYGDDTNSPESITPDSVAGHLENLKNTKIDKTPELIPALADLNAVAYEVTGFYVQPSVPNSRSGTNYPAVNNLFYPGMLRVVNRGGLVFQEYHLIGETGNIINTVYWRVKYLGVWSTWKASIDRNEFLIELDNRYFQRSFLYTRSELYTRTEADNRYSPRLFTETATQTQNYTPSLLDINRIVVMNVSGEGTLTIPTNAAVPFPIGSVFNIYNISSGLLNIASAAGVTLRNSGKLERFREASVRKRGTNEWVAAGPLY
jgi:hypothetical protein